jgi:hypothetical protein
VLVQGASANDVVEMVAFDIFSVNDSVSAKDGGSFAGDIGMGGTLAVTGVPTFTGRSVHSGGITVANGGQIGSVGDTDAMAIASNGVVNFTVAPTVNGAAIGTDTSTSLTIGDGSVQDIKLLFDGNAQDFHIGIDDTDDSLKIGLGTALGTTPHMIFDPSGQITKPLQPAFEVIANGAQTNDDNGTLSTILWQTEVFDQNSDFTSNTFTAPITGRYQLNVNVQPIQIPAAATSYEVVLNTSNRSHSARSDTAGDTLGNANIWAFSVLADMDAGDTASLTHRQYSGGSGVTDIEAGSSFSGFLAC